MEIKRIDPYLAAWCVDGAVAIAAESGGIQLLVPDASKLLRGDVQWRRMRSPELGGRVVAMAWSPTGCSAYAECVLAYVLDTGAAGVLENSSGQTEPWSLRAIDGDYSACAWRGTTLLLGSNDGRIHAVAPDLQTLWTADAPATAANAAAANAGRVVHVATNAARLVAAFADNSVWACEPATRRWEPLLAASRFRVCSVAGGGTAPVVARTDGVFTFGTGAPVFTPVRHYVPAHLLVVGDDWALVHTDGHVSQGPRAVPLPEIRGRVFGAMGHAVLPIGLLLLGPVSADWEYPIVSWQWAKTAFFVLSGPLPPPRVTDCAAHMYWAALLVTEKPPPVLDVGAYAGPTAAEGPTALLPALKELFTSAWFDTQRLKWYVAPDERQSTLAAMRAQIARLVCATPATTDLDHAIVRWYAAYLEPAAAAGGGQKAEEGGQLQLELSGDSVRDSFIVEPEQADVVASQAGHVWKRCSLTLVPLLSLNTRVSLDHEFSAYRAAPGRSAIADALLGAGRFCVFSGTQWERPRF